MRKTSFNFSQRATLKSSHMEESKLVAMRRTFYGTGSRDNLLLLPELFLGGLASAFISRTSSKIRAIAITSTNIR